jgi:hypothetical protein
VKKRIKTLLGLIIFPSVILLAGCPKKLEKKGDKYIASIYQALVTGGVGPYGEGLTVYEITVQESPIIDSLMPKLTASNIAVLAFEGLSDSDRLLVEGVVVNLRTTKGQTATYSFKSEILLQVSQKAELYRKYSDMILSGDFEKVKNFKDPGKNYPAYRENWPDKISELQSLYGKLKGYVPFGIREFRNTDGQEFQFFGYLQFESRYFPYKIDFEVANEQEQWSNLLIKENLR